ncbi:MAG: hypothetical protein Q8P13_02700 [bacterium]|nr:hypothetical protein [bacterium]
MIGSQRLGLAAVLPFLWQEGRALTEIALLALFEQSYRRQLSEKGSAVLLIPDLHCSDSSLQLLWWDLSVRGFRVYFSDFPVNQDNGPTELSLLRRRVRELSTKLGEKLNLLCHNQAALLGEELRRQEPRWVEKVVVLGAFKAEKPEKPARRKPKMRLVRQLEEVPSLIGQSTMPLVPSTRAGLDSLATAGF